MELKPEAIGEHSLEHQPEFGTSMRGIGLSFNVEADGRKLAHDREGRDVVRVWISCQAAGIGGVLDEPAWAETWGLIEVTSNRGVWEKPPKATRKPASIRTPPIMAESIGPASFGALLMSATPSRFIERSFPRSKEPELFPVIYRRRIRRDHQLAEAHHCHTRPRCGYSPVRRR